MIKIQIKIKTEDSTNNSKRIYGKEYDEVYHIGVLEEHYFIIEPIQYTSYSIKNYQELLRIIVNSCECFRTFEMYKNSYESLWIT